MSELKAVAKNRRVDRRLAPRQGTRVTCTKGSLGLGKNLALSLLDVSETGVRLILASALDCHQQVEVGLLGPGQCRPVKFMADVVWCVPAADGTFCVGAHFQKRMHYRDFQSVCK